MSSRVVDALHGPAQLLFVSQHASPPVTSGDHHATAVTRAVRSAALVLFAIWVWRYMHHEAPLLHGSLLVFHEAGHILFMPFGEFATVLGGSLFQLMVPAFFVAYFAHRRDWFAAAFAGLYLAASIAGVAVYIADARAGELPLLGGDRSNHDWTYLLIEMNALQLDTTIGWYAMKLGGLCYWVSLVAGLRFAWTDPGTAAARAATRAAEPT